MPPRRIWAAAILAVFTFVIAGRASPNPADDQHYSTHKLGLALLAARHLSLSAELPPNLVGELLALQDDSGGWITDYDAKGRRIGLANVETTCLCVLGLEAFIGQGQIPDETTGPNFNLPGHADVVPLPSARLLFAEQEWGALGVNKSVEGNPLRAGGKSYPHGLGTHAHSKLIYSLDRKYERFDAVVGVDDEMQSFGKSSVVFKVFGDERELFNSGVMRRYATSPRQSSGIRGRVFEPGCD